MCQQKCSNRKIVFTEMKLSYNFANQLADIVRNDSSIRIAHLNLARNNLRDSGSLLIASAVKQSYSIVSLNLMHNEISPVGMAQIFDELSYAKTLCTLLIGADDSFNRNRVGQKSVESLC